MRLYVLLAAILTLAACSQDDGESMEPSGSMDMDLLDASSDLGMSDDPDADLAESDLSEPPDMSQPDQGGMDADPLFDPGPHAVGFLEAEITFEDLFGSERTLPVKVWYPATSESEASPVVYRVAGLLNLPSENALNAPPPSQEGPFPTMVYSHGSGGEGLLAYPYAEHYASWGWVLISPNHVGNTVTDQVQETELPFAANVVHRVQDITEVLDSLDRASADEGLDILAGAADTTQVFLFGHSFGAYTTLAVGGADLDAERFEQAQCSENMASESCMVAQSPAVATFLSAGFGDERVVAIAPQAPGLVPLFGDGELAALTVPTMLQSGRLDQTTTQEAQAVPTWEGLDGEEDIWVDLPTGAHYTFISICEDLPVDLLALFLPDAVEDGCGEEFVPTTEAIPILRAYLFAFARLHVLGEESFRPTLEGDPLDDRFVITRPE